MIDPVVIRLLVAALAGLAVGVEREWSGHTSGPNARFAGVRTFLLIGGAGGISGLLASSGSTALAAVIMAAIVALTVVAYFALARTGGEGVEATTEVAAIVVLALGVLAGLGFVQLTSGATAVVLLVLSEKSRMHDAVRRLGQTELRAAMHFAVLALVVLPLLPDESYGPLGGVRPRSLWMVVLIFSALNFAGYIARRLVGATRGLGVTGMLGGLISSTAVTLHFSRQSRLDKQYAAALGVGAVGACLVLIPRVIGVSAVLNSPVAMALIPYLVWPFAAGLIFVSYLVYRQRNEPSGQETEEVRSPLRVMSAIRMAVAFQVALMAVEYVQTTFGNPGIFASAALLGLTDVDALTIAMNRLGESDAMVPIAARAITIGIVANSVLKFGITVALGSSPFRVVASTGLAVLALVTAGALLVAA